jgi:hypothetical protein
VSSSEKKLLMAGNGAKLIEHHVEESHISMVFTFLFDKPMHPADFVDFYGRASGKNVVFPVLQRAGWFTRGSRPKTAFAMHEKMISSEDGKAWELSFFRKNDSLRGF